MSIYATPGALGREFPYGKMKSRKGGRWIEREQKIGSVRFGRAYEQNLARITWNSIGESLLDVMKRDGLNIPKVGAYFKYPPLTTFYCYTLGKHPPNVCRLGKKLAPIRVSAFPLTSNEKSGKFRPTCPVNVIDLPETTNILEGSLLTVPPAPLLTNSQLEGEYLEATDEFGIHHIIPKPAPERFPTAFQVVETTS
jgi:hypothetical protein